MFNYINLLVKQSVKSFKVVGLVLLFAVLVGCNTSQIVLVDNVTQQTANDIILLLGNNDINASRQLLKDGNYTISVKKADQIAALALLKKTGKPGQGFTSFGEVFKKDSFISSPIEEQGRFIFALEQEISSMVSHIDGVITVKTQVTLPPPVDNLWQAEAIKPSAAVFIKYDNSYRLDLYINKIKQLVANSVPGLSLDRVAVLSMSQN
ncbi:MAG: type III secretion inner membrane ring lipoprotein SctJ [Proteobacteria bacterium]|nr:type III secretion inner membrane ring lipoprotein SctJ [Pseudomonadota bacterium]